MKLKIKLSLAFFIVLNIFSAQSTFLKKAFITNGSLLCLFLLFLSLTSNAQNSTNFIALDDKDNLYDVNPTKCTYTSLSLCSSITKALSIALSGNTIYVVDNTGQLWKQNYISGSCTSLGYFTSASISSTIAKGYYGLTVDSKGIVYASTGSYIDKYNPITNTFSNVGVLPAKWKIGGDLIFDGSDLYIACKNLDLVKVNLANLTNSKVQSSFAVGSSIFGLSTVSDGCSTNKVYALDTQNAKSTDISSLDITTGLVSSVICNLPFTIYDTASLSENGTYVKPLAPSVAVTQPSCKSTTATIAVSPVLAGYSYSIDGINFTNKNGIFTGIAANTNYSILAKDDASGCVSPATTGKINATPLNNIVPTFSFPDVCINSAATLPTTSANVPPLSGSWDSVINTANSGSFTFYFTPDVGQCAVPNTMTPLTVNVVNCEFNTFASAAMLKICGATSRFYNITGSGTNLINPSSPAGDFMTDLGTFIQNSGALIFYGGELKTSKTVTANVCVPIMHYNVHPKGAVAGLFEELKLNDKIGNCSSGTFDFGGGPCKAGDQKWQNVVAVNGGLGENLTTLPLGDYVLEVYYEVPGSSNTTTKCDEILKLNNGGANYLSYFSIQGDLQYASANPTTCSGSEGTITISGLLANTNYTLSYKDDSLAVGPTNITSDATGVFIISGLNAGSYSNFLLEATCGSYTNNTPIVLINPELIASIAKTDNSVCQSITVPCNGSATVTPTGSGSYSYLWNDTLAQTTATATALCPGSYNVTVTDKVSLCFVNLPITVGNTAVLPAISSVTKGTSPICSGSNASFTINGTPDASVSYTLNAEPTQIVVLNASGNALVTVNQVTSDTTILLSQISLSSCSSTLANTETVVVSSPPNAGNLSGEPVICSNGTTNFASTVSGGVWSSSNISVATIDATSGEISAVSSGTATMTYSVAGTGGCKNEATATRLVTISSAPIVSITAGCIDKEYTLEAFPEIGVTYKWFKGDFQLTEISSELVVKTLGSYIVEINNSGCTAQASAEVTSFYCEIPKGISPNGDEFNEYFDLSNRNVKKLEIFNRYGVKVYSKTNYKKEWDGKSDGGQELPDATYYYVIEEEGNAPITGWVYINR